MANTLKIKTNNQWRPFKYRHDVPAKVLAKQFDWTNPEEYSDHFICYRRHWYHIADFMRGGPEGWDGIASDSYFSGVLIRVSKDGERYQIAAYFS